MASDAQRELVRWFFAEESRMGSGVTDDKFRSLDANGAPVESAEHNLRLWLANHLARGHFRGLDADAPFPLPGDVAEAPPRPASDAIIR